MLTTLTMFGDRIKSDILINIVMSKDDSFEWASSILFIIMVLLHTPLIFFIGKESLLTIYCEYFYHTISEDRSVAEDIEDNHAGNILVRHIKNDANISTQLDHAQYYPITL